MPTSIAKHLCFFCRNFWDEQNLSLAGTCVTFNLYDESWEQTYRCPIKNFESWSVFVERVNELLISVRDWYAKENNSIEPNFIPYLEFIGSDRDLFNNNKTTTKNKAI